MQIDYALILSAGLGTRMGDIGKIIPKVMWPVFGKPLIDYHVDYCLGLGIKKIYVNTHYLSDVLETHLKKKWGDQVIILHEDPLLDSGGAIHNLASQKDVNYSGNVLLINGDQFYLFESDFYQKGLKQLETCRASLFGIRVKKGEKYNETKIENDLLVSIDPQNNENDFNTYSGTGLLKLDGLKPMPGATKFFTTVCDYKNEKIGMILPSSSEYWDFGTAPIYAKNIKLISNEINKYPRISNFLNANQINVENLKKYYSKELNSVRLKLEDQFHENCIVGYGVNQTY